MRANVLIKCLRERRFEHRLADRLAGARQFGDVIDIEFGEHAIDAFGQTFIGQELAVGIGGGCKTVGHRSEEHTSELQSLMRISYAVFCLKKKKKPKVIQ